MIAVELFFGWHLADDSDLLMSFLPSVCQDLSWRSLRGTLYFSDYL